MGMLPAGIAAGAEPIVPPDTTVQRLAGGFKFTEGPAWDRKGSLYFSDIPQQTILRWTEAEGAKPFKKLDGSCNGLFFDAAGDLLVCQPVGRAVRRITPNGEVSVVVDSYAGKKLNSPNDLWVAPNGGLYFTDPRYGPENDLEQDGFHVYYLPAGAKQATRILDNLKKPNGIVGSTDGTKLYVTDPGAQTTYVYRIEPDGSLTNRQVAAAAGSDGLTLDEKGNLYITGKSIRIFGPDAQQVGEIPLPEVAANLTFGGADRKTLFITARTSLYSIRLNVRGGGDPFAKD